MTKKIEIVPASDPQVLKQQLERMVNEGWEIKGVVDQNGGSGPFVILEHFSVEDTISEAEARRIEEPSNEPYYVRSGPPQKEISISVGGD
jgi:hypothetical protein